MIFVHKKIKEICQGMILEEFKDDYGFKYGDFTYQNYRIWYCGYLCTFRLSRLKENIPLGFFETIYINRAARKYFAKRRLEEELKQRELLDYIN